ncbi:MAG: head-tail connector protein, partial [Planctomycetota bacterium]
MSVKQLNAPGVFLDLAKLKHHIRVEHDVDNYLIESLGFAAIDFFERACGITIAPRSFVLTLTGFPTGPIRIPNPPTTAVSSIVYV